MRGDATRAAAEEATPGSASSTPARGAHRGLSAVRTHAPLVLANLAVLAWASGTLALAWFTLCRLAYVGFVGLALRAESRRATFSRRHGAEEAWRRFRGVAERLMFADAVALAVLCLVTRGTLAIPGPTWVVLAVGLVLVALGLGVKFWAAASLDEGTFYWRDFFVPREHRAVSVSGPYRWLSDPMYSVGYAHAYGLALLLGSGPGLAGAAFSQVAILLLARLVERPHLLRRHRA